MDPIPKIFSKQLFLTLTRNTCAKVSFGPHLVFNKLLASVCELEDLRTYQKWIPGKYEYLVKIHSELHLTRYKSQLKIKLFLENIPSLPCSVVLLDRWFLLTLFLSEFEVIEELLMLFSLRYREFLKALKFESL